MWVEQSGASISLSALLLISSLCGVVAGFMVASAMRMARRLDPRRRARLRAAVHRAEGQAQRAGCPSSRKQFPEALDLIARALKAGHAFATGLKMVADEMPEPIGPEFRKAFDEQNFGLPLKDALTNLTRARSRCSTCGSSPPPC